MHEAAIRAYTYSVYGMPKVVQLSGEAYERLRMAKRPGESYSDVVLRLLPRGDLRGLHEIWLEMTPAERRQAERFRRMGEAADRAEARESLRRWRRGRA